MPEDLLPELREIIKTSLQQSPQMLQKNIELIMAEASSLQLSAGLWPNLGSGAYYGASQAASADSTSSAKSRSSGLSYNLYMGQALYQWGTVKARADIGKIGVKMAEKNYAEAAQALVASVRGQYLGLIVGKVAVRNIRFALQQEENNLNLEEEKLKAGLISSLDIIPPRLQVAEVRLQCDRTLESYEQAKRTFLRLTGLASLNEEALPQSLPPVKYDAALASALLSRFLHEGIERTRPAQNYQLTIRQAELNYRIAKFGLYPKFSFNANIAQSFNTSVSNGIVSQGAVVSQGFSVGAGWPIFDGFSTRGAKISSLAGKRSAERSYQNYLDSTKDQARGFARQIDFSAQVMALAEIRRNLTEGNYKRTQEDLSLGLVSQTAVGAATYGFYQSELNELGSRVDYLSRWADFVSLLGIDPALNNLPARFLDHGK